MAELLKDTITVEVDGANYDFAIPGYSEEMRVGIRERDIRREIDPATRGSSDGLDYETNFLVRTAAVFEVLLKRASVEWPFSPGPDGKPIVDHKKWPKEHVTTAAKVGTQFGIELGRFRSGGTADGDGASPQTVAS